MSSLTSLLDGYFGPIILREFLGGLYILLFVQAVWKLLRRRAHVPYIFALILLWISPISIGEKLIGFPIVIEFVPVFVATVVSDGILIWRCYVLWQTNWSVSILVTLLVASSACYIYTVVAQSSISALLSLGLNQVLSAATTVCATTMIALKIIIVTRKSRMGYSYSKVMDILVQSAALQSLVMVVNSIAEFGGYIMAASNPNNLILAIVFQQINAYTSSCQILVIGIAPTMIAFRVAEEEPRIEVNSTDRTSPQSRLTFRRSERPIYTDYGAQLTVISTVRLDLTQREDSLVSIHDGPDLDDDLNASARLEKEIHLTCPESV